MLPEQGVAGSGSQGGTTGLGGNAAEGGLGGASDTQACSPNASNWPAELIHRYDFAGTGTQVFDRVDCSVGTIESVATGATASLDGTGQLSITDGVSYVKLPPWLIKNAKSSSLTIAVWFTLNQNNRWARVFDFGATNEGTEQPGTAIAQFYLTSRSEPNSYYSVVLDNDCNTGGQAVVEPPTTFPVGTPVNVAVVVEGDDALGTSSLRLYLNGAEVTSSLYPTVAQRLTAFTDQHCWLGLSQWTQDNTTYQHFDGSYDEFRIYSRALTAAEVAGLSLTDPSVL